jgi:hypothetical protein
MAKCYDPQFERRNSVSTAMFTVFLSTALSQLLETEIRGDLTP